jgi:hypothetical protein
LSVSPLRLALRVESTHLEVPVADFEHLALELRCQLGESRREVTLSSAQGRLVFDRVGPLGLLREIAITDDADGLFTVHVLGRLLAAYEGELHATVTTAPAEVYPARLTVRHGESSHPLFTTVMLRAAPALSQAQLEAIDALLDEAKGHWQRWLESKGVSDEERSR